MNEVAADYTVIAEIPRTPGPNGMAYFMASSMEQLPDGTLVAAIGRGHNHPVRGKGLDGVVVCNSRDGGETWQQVADLPYDSCEPVLHVHQGRLYMIITPNRSEYERGTNFPREENGRIWVSVTDDAGASWSDPVLVYRSETRLTSGGQGAMLERNGILYLTLSERYQAMAAVKCDLSKGLLCPEAWEVTPLTPMPIPEEVVHPMLQSFSRMRCLEGSVVEVSGRLLVIARTILNGGGTAGMGAVFEIVDTPGEALRFEFRMLHPIPGGQMKFYIQHDARSGLYWMASNLAANPGFLVQDEAWDRAKVMNPYATERRFLSLWYSVDSLNWLPAGWIACAQHWTRSFHYPVTLIDGEDLLVISRTGIDSGNQHDVDFTTFHRVRNFRSLAIDPTPRFDNLPDAP